MQAVRLHQYGGTDMLRLEEVEQPQPGANQVLIKTAVAGINYADTMLRAGTYPMKPELPYTLGFEVAGTVEAVGEGVEGSHLGRRVMAMMLQGGGYAEYAVADATHIIPVPDDLEFGKATALLAQGLTALGLLKDLQAGQTILVHAAAGGVGSLLIQLAKHKGARVIGTASTKEKLAIVESLGADASINYTEADWTDQVLAATEGDGVDLLIEMVGGEIGEANTKCLAQGATMILYGSASGEDFHISAQAVLFKSLKIQGYTLYDETPETLRGFTEELMAHVSANRLQVIVQEFPFAEAAQAHAALEGRKTSGKVVLTF